MAKVKVKKEMTLPEIIQWGWDNEIKNEEFMANLGGCIYFDEDSYIDIEEDNLIAPEERFEVEVEEEITEKTVIPEILHVYEYGGDTITSLDKNYSISSLIKMNEHRLDLENLAFYMLNDDMTMTLIWRNGGMAE
ncbi:hypothetical protein [Staphylococcus chromogenes]|uniref:hypothetical protein n=1 Tax=Staphylococcus chromogenes TaxID=46126 RepID=UPI002886EE04|nr:hypothetical protein [Staphylococcus chromogenes]MDT0739750.1 hypothetical protein [Staphylococcus chromogenes]